MKHDSDSLTNLKEYLDREALRINNTDFIANDPVQSPRRFDRLQDIEIVSILSAAIAWGNRKMICNNCEKMLHIMNNQPYNYVMDKAYEELPDMNIHRTFFARDFRHMLRGFNRIYDKYGSLHEFAKTKHVGSDEAPSWKLVALMQEVFAEATDGNTNSQPMCYSSIMKRQRAVLTTIRPKKHGSIEWICQKDINTSLRLSQ